MRKIWGKLADHVEDHVVLSPEGAVLVTSLGTESSYPRPPQSLNNSDLETTRATWDAANQDLYSVLFFTTAGSTFSVVWRFQGKTLAEGAGHEQQA